MQTLTFDIRGEFITLDRLLKATGLAASGGAAKTLVADGHVQVDGRDVAIALPAHRWFVLNKPAGVMTTQSIDTKL